MLDTRLAVAAAAACARVPATARLPPQPFRAPCFVPGMLERGSVIRCRSPAKWQQEEYCRPCRLEMSPMEQEADRRTAVATTTREDEKEALQRELDELREENSQLRQALEDAEQEQSRMMPMKVVLESFETGGTNSLPQDYMELETGTIVRTECDNDDDDDFCPLDEPNVTFRQAFRERVGWLVGLLTLQSVSGLILADNEALLQNHPDIVFFLTMLVGAGGNAGNQASVRVIRGIALGTLREDTQWRFLWREFRMAVGLSLTLALAGTLRAVLFGTPGPETMAIATSLWLIVACSIGLGALLPLGLQKFGIDPAHSSTTIQVVMDIMGVVLTVMVSHFLLDAPLGQSVVQGILGVGG